ncbi:NUDIX hydrolase domain-like protein [Desarmillaria tabescens]|uniref:NUDIX hydrolase domain-like protein n=1 Tax=Armillaria tabescens TaxID=1929756 RepID=A0AA39NAB9_ARMTA|nr:NUDIX hydrolase domain-like protein [Desarmillaria tabescens]KAK0461971.1 NUDIX hydrolase domain-like protein [Desarmillaria tabescens]
MHHYHTWPLAAVATAAGFLLLPWFYRRFKKPAHPRYPKQTNHSSDQFVLAAGAVAFLISQDKPLKVCLVYYKKRNEWLLAKGRKDEGEDLATTAVREVLEETGYACTLLPVALPTRATLPSASVAHQEDIPRLSQNCTESFAITIRPLQQPKNVKLIFWYVASLDDPEGAPCVGTHMVAEGFEESVLFEVDKALEKLTFEDDKDLLRLAAKYAEQYKCDRMASR